MHKRSEEEVRTCELSRGRDLYLVPPELQVVGPASWEVAVRMARACRAGLLVLTEDQAQLVVCGECYRLLTGETPPATARVR